MVPDKQLPVTAVDSLSSNVERLLVQCAHCKNVLLPASKMCFYTQYSSGLHFCLKYEMHRSVVGSHFQIASSEEATAEKGIFVFKDQTDEKIKIFAPHTTNCGSCKEYLGNVCFMGPQRERIVCFTYNRVIICKDGERIGHGKWSTMANFLPEIERRNPETFYNGVEDPNELEQDELWPAGEPTTLRRPELADLMHLNLRDLTVTKPRSYQIECFVFAALSNSIVYLPTGSGKTLVASMLIHLMAQLNPSKSILFVVHRVPLAFQQGQAIQDETGLEVLIACGETVDEGIPSKRPLASYPIIICTAQVLINWIKRRRFRLEDVSLLVIDEVHHSIKSHPFAVLIRELYCSVPDIYRPLFMGLTASPATGQVSDMFFTIGEISTPSGASIYMPILYYDDLQSTANRPSVKFSIANMEEVCGEFGEKISQVCGLIFKKVTGILGEAIPVAPSLIDDASTRGLLRILSDRAHVAKNELAVDSIMFLNQLYSAYELNNVLGPRYAAEYIFELFKKRQNAPKEHINGHIITKESLDVEEEYSILQNDLVSLAKLPVSSKLTELVKLLSKHDSQTDSRVIVFVSTKKTARWLCKILKEQYLDIAAHWDPAFFVGAASGQIDGMKWTTDQAPILQKFRLGEHKLLISTSVLQEGIDVPVCNLVILFDQSCWNLTGLIQSRGRARAESSRYVLICSSEEKSKYEKLLEQEQNMERLVTKMMETKGSLTFKNVLVTIKLTQQALAAADWMLDSSQANQKGSDIHGKRNISGGKILRKLILSIHLAGDICEDSLHFWFEESGLSFRITGPIRREEDTTLGINVKQAIIELEPSLPHALRYSEFIKHQLYILCMASLRLKSLKESINGTTHAPGILISLLYPGMRPSVSDSCMEIAEKMKLGTLISPNLFSSLQTLPTPSLKFGYSIIEQMIRLFFVGKDQRVFRIDIEFQSIDKFMIIDEVFDLPEAQDDKDTKSLAIKDRIRKLTLTIPLNQVPFLYFSHQPECLDIKLSNMDKIAWERGIGLDFESFLRFGQASTIKLEFELTARKRDHFIEGIQRFEANGIKILHGNVEEANQRMDFLSAEQVQLEIMSFKSFEVRYALETLFSSCIPCLGYTVRQSFFDILKMEAIHDSTRLQAIVQLAIALADRRFADPEVEISNLLSKIEQGQLFDEKVSLPFEMGDKSQEAQSNTTLIRFVTVTPTRIIFHAPKKMTRNRILRSFQSEFFLRVQFRDEDQLKMSSVRTEASLRNLLDRVHQVLLDGISVGGRHFEFLAMSSSQLRDHGCWFVAPHSTCDAEGQLIQVDASYIRSWCGDFSEIDNVAKYVARLGQSLSASQDTVTVSPYEFSMIPDITVHNGKREYNFTDGIGMISPKLAEEISKQMKFPRLVSAFQVRFAGFKGVLSVDPRRENESGKHIYFRKSMEKFKSQHYVLEVLNHAQYIPCFLNRQVIMIISSLGVPDHAFMDLQDAMFESMSQMMIDSKKSTEYLSSHYHILPNPGLSKLSTSAHGSAMHVCVEPFLRSLLLASYKKSLSELITRSRVFVPRGRILLGVIDETGTLGERELFVQFSRVIEDGEDEDLSGHIIDSDRNLVTVCGKVLIAKNPCMHPGDVRIMTCVDNPLLRRYHYDVIVYPAVGPRPITDQCSGSDLDGDLYFVTWDPNLIPPSEYPPMDYDPPFAAIVKDGGIQVDHIKKFMVDFIANDQLGTIANAHVAHSDSKPEGVCDELCVRLAYIFSMAVDFPKTGYVPTFPKEARVEKWPDFMQKTTQQSYVSEKVIGRMFRKAKSIFFSPAFAREPLVKVDSRFVWPGYEAFIESAQRLYKRYCQILASTLCLYGIREEAQIFSGSLLEFGILGKEDRHQAMEVVGGKIREIHAALRQSFFTDSIPHSAIPNDIDWSKSLVFWLRSEAVHPFINELLAKASAWYHVAYTMPECPVGMNMPILSFPWILGDVLEIIIERCASTTLATKDVASPFAMIGCSILEAIAKEWEVDDYCSLMMERIHFFQLLRSNLKCRLGKTSFELAMTGSSSTFIYCRGSDINFTIVGDKVSILDVYTVVVELFPLATLTQRRIDYKGPGPFAFTISKEEADTCDLQVSTKVRQWLDHDHLGASLTMAVMLWARSQNLVRRNRHHQGKMSATDLALHIMNQRGWSPETAMIVEEASEDFRLSSEFELKRFGRLLSQMTSVNAKELGSSLMSLFKQLVNFDSPVLSELGFKAYYLLCQTLDAQSLWDGSVGLEVEQEVALARRPKLLKKIGQLNSGSMFMEGCSVVMFEGANSSLDPVTFELYTQRRRPQHFDAQCFVPILSSSEDADGVLTIFDGKLYNDFLNHAIRQMNLARTNGSPDYGHLRMSIKFGTLYLTNLPRLFLEEGNSANVQNVQRALDLGYKSVGDGRAEKLVNPKIGVQLEPIRMAEEKEKEKVKEPESNAANLDDSCRPGSEAISKSVTATARKRSSLTPMSSSFEPHIDCDESIRKFLQQCGFAMNGEALSGYSVSLTLFNSLSSQNTDFQIIYDDQMQFLRSSFRGLRWMVVDVIHNAEDDEDEEMSRKSDATKDVRIQVSSTRSFELTNVAEMHGQEIERLEEGGGGDYAEMIRQGIVEFVNTKEDEQDRPQGRRRRIRISQPFRTNERIFVRHSVSEKYRPTAASLAHLRGLFGEVAGEEERFLTGLLMDHLQVCLLYVSEWSDHDQGTGLFGEPVEKIEVEVQLSGLDWVADLLGSQQQRILARTAWALAYWFRRGLRTASDHNVHMDDL